MKPMTRLYLGAAIVAISFVTVSPTNAALIAFAVMLLLAWFAQIEDDE